VAREIDFENEIRDIIHNNIIAFSPDFQILKSKNITDIIICRNNNIPKLFFIEIKYYNIKNNRIGFGTKGKICFQPEILLTTPKYFNDNLRWLFKNEIFPDKYYILDNNECNKYVRGNNISIDKQNNFSDKLFKNVEPKSKEELIEYIKIWLNT